MENKESKPSYSQVGPVDEFTSSDLLAGGDESLLLEEGDDLEGILLGESFEGNLIGPEDKWV